MVRDDLTPPTSSDGNSPATPTDVSQRSDKRRRDSDTGSEREERSKKERLATDGEIFSTNGFITLSEETSEITKTHFHFPNLSTFINNLNVAHKSKWKTRMNPYENVIALLISWKDDDLGVVEEINELKSIFRDTYKFSVETWAIPSGKWRCFNLVRKIQSLLESDDAQGTLFVFYYGGHAYQDGQSQPIWVSYVELICQF